MKAFQLFVETETANSYLVLWFNNPSIVQELQRAARAWGKRSFVIPSI